MSAELKEINPRRADPEAVALLEHLLDEAKRGELIGVVVVTVMSEQRCGGGWAGAAVRDQLMPTIGEIEVVKQRLISNVED